MGAIMPPARNVTATQALAIEEGGWIRPVDQKSLPPRADPVSSVLVFLALSDGSVAIGSCIFRPRNATYPEPVHAWFALEPDGSSSSLDCDHWRGAKVVAWRPFVLPSHPLKR